MKVASRTSRIVPSPTLKITATAKSMVKKGIDVADFSAGEPESDTPDFVKQAAEAAIREGFTKYTAVGGIEELRQAICDKFKRDQGLQYDTSQVLVSCGAKHSLYNIAQVLFESGDEVLIPSPYWVSYPDIVHLADATAVFIETDEAKHYAIDPKALESSISSNTKGLILNSPCNPTGMVYSRSTLEAIAEIALRYNLWIISDEIYEKLVFDNTPHVSIASLSPEVAKQTIVVNGVSKAFAMTGWRIGYAAGPKEIIVAMTNIQSQSTSNPASISQKAALAALLGNEDFFAELVGDLAQKRAAMVEGLNQIKGIVCPQPKGAFYAFPNITQLLGRTHPHGTLATPADLASYLLEKAHVACVPGEPFGSTSHIRFSYTPNIQVIQKGLARMSAALATLT